MDSTSSTTTTNTAATFLQLFLNEVNHEDVQELLNTQKSLLEQLDKTNEKLDGVNRLSSKRYLDATRDFNAHTQLLTSMKTDLDLIFKRIKILKTRLNRKYPEAYAAAMQTASTEYNSLEDDEEEIHNSLTSSAKSLVKSQTIDCSQLSALRSIPNENSMIRKSSHDH